MGGTSFRIDLDEVEAAAKAIRTMLDDLEAPTARLEAVINQIKPTAYGTEAVGKSLTGGSSSVGGLPDHQQQVFAGVKAYLQNSAQMAANLELMVQRYRQTEDSQTEEISRLNGGRGGESGTAATPVATAPLRQVVGTRVLPDHVPLTAVDGTQVAPASEEARPDTPVHPVSVDRTPVPPPHPAESAYHTPDAPDLNYNEHHVHRDPEPRTMPGGHQLI